MLHIISSLTEIFYKSILIYSFPYYQRKDPVSLRGLFLLLTYLWLNLPKKQHILIGAYLRGLFYCFIISSLVTRDSGSGNGNGSGNGSGSGTIQPRRRFSLDRLVFHQLRWSLFVERQSKPCP